MWIVGIGKKTVWQETLDKHHSKQKITTFDPVGKKSVLSQRGYIFDTCGGILYHHIKCILYIQHYSVNFTPSTKLSSYWIKEQGEKNWRPLQSESPGIQTFYWRKISSDQKQNVGNSHLPADSRAEVFDQDSVIRPGWGPVPETLNVENKVNTTWAQSLFYIYTACWNG